MRIQRYNILAGLVFFGMLSSALSTFGQDSYAIVNTANSANLSEYRDALKKIDLEAYRLDGERKVLKFTSGVEVVLYSRRETTLGMLDSAPKVSANVQVMELHPGGQIAVRAPQTQEIMSKATAPSKPKPVYKLPEGFPVQQNTGDAKSGQEKYAKDKQQWIAENPEEYRKMNSGSSEKQMISKEEYDKMSKEKRKKIKDSENYSIKK